MARYDAIPMVRFSALLPFGPVFEKELRVTARRKRTYLLRVAYVGLLLFVLFVVNEAAGIFSHGRQSAVAYASELAELGYTFFCTFAVFSTVAMCMVGPILTSGAISEERTRKTIEVLMTTPLSAWQIVGGKLFSRLLVALTLIGLSVPILAIVRLMGGVEIEQIIAVISICTATVVATASLGLLVSAYTMRAWVAIILSYAILAVIYLLLPAVMAHHSGRTSLVACNPFAAVVTAIEPRIFSGSVDWRWFVASHIGAGFLLTFWTARVLRRRQRTPQSATDTFAGPADSRRAAGVPVAAAGLAGGEGDLNATTRPSTPALGDDPLAGVQNAPRRKRAPVYDNPVLWRELRRPTFRSIAHRVAAIVFGGLVLALIYNVASHNGNQEFCISMAYIYNLLFMVQICVLSATAISQETESDTWRLLLTTPLSGSQIVFGKVGGVLRRSVLLLVIIALHMVVFAPAKYGTIEDGAAALLMIFSANALFSATGLMFSLLFRRSSTAAMLNMAMPAVLYIGGYWFVRLLNDDWQSASDFVSSYLPYNFLTELYHSPFEYEQGGSSLGLFGNALTAGEVRSTTVAASVGYLTLTSLLLGLVGWKFDFLVRRRPQRGAAEPGGNGLGHTAA